MEKKQTRTKKESAAHSKKEKTTKEKKVIPKYYVGTEVRRLPKVPKAALTDLNNLKGLSMTPEQQEAFLTAIIMGFVPDKFGLEAGLDHKLKALTMLKDLQTQNQNTSETGDNEVVIIDDIN